MTEESNSTTAKPLSLPLSDEQAGAKRERLFRRIMAGGVLTFIVFSAIGAEFVTRYYERHRSTPSDYFPSIYYPHRRLRYGLVPNTDYYGWFKINSLGFRGGEVSVQKRPGVLRIVCLGGSTTFDIGSVGAARPWPEVLEENLRRRLGTSAVEVLNLGIGGATSLDSLIDLQTRAMKFDPDLVIVFQGHNDLIYSIPPTRRQRSSLYPQEDRPRSSLIRWLTYHSLLYAKSEERVATGIGGIVGTLKRAVSFGRWADEPGEDRDQAMEKGLADFRSNITALAAIARANHVRLALVAPVIPFARPDETQGPCAICGRLSATYAGIATSKLESMFGRYDQVLAKAADTESGIFYISTDGFIPSADRYYHDPVHFAPEGSLRMGTKLAEALEPILRPTVSTP